MKTYYDPMSSNTSASSSENIRFKNTFIRLVDDITSMTSQPERENPYKLNKSKQNYTPNKINSYKLNLFINGDTPDTRRTARLFSPQKTQIKEKSKIYDIDAFKVETNFKATGFKTVKRGNFLNLNLKLNLNSDIDKHQVTEQIKKEKIGTIKSDILRLLERENRDKRDIAIRSPKRQEFFKSSNSLNSIKSIKSDENKKIDFFENTKRVNKMKEIVHRSLTKNFFNPKNTPRDFTSPQKNKISSTNRINWEEDSFLQDPTFYSKKKEMIPEMLSLELLNYNSH